MRKRKGQIEQSSGNVFADLGLVDPEARLARAELARRIGDLIAERATASSARAHGLDTRGGIGAAAIDYGTSSIGGNR